MSAEQTSLGDFTVSQDDSEASNTTNPHRVMTDGGPNGDDLDFNFEDLRFIRVADDSKFPMDKWGGYSQDFDSVEDVYTHEEVLESTYDRWGVVGIDAPEFSNWYLFILDLDIYKSDEYDIDDFEIIDGHEVPFVKSQNGGVHLYFALHAPISESDINLNYDWIDLRGDAVKSHVVAPADIPGCEGCTYDLMNDASIPVFFSVGEVLDRVSVDGEPLGEHNPSNPVNVEFECGEAPDEMTDCYHAALSFRASDARDEHPNAFKIDTFAGLLGLAAGYDIDTVTEHFGEFAPHGDKDEFDENLTREHLERLARKMETENFAPPAISTLREHGILNADESCPCEISYHGGTPVARKSRSATPNQASTFHSSSTLEFWNDECGHWTDPHPDSGEDPKWIRVANFRLEVLSYLFEDGNRLIELEVIPSSGEDPYTVTVPATVFNDTRTFKSNVVTGITTTWEGTDEPLNELRKLVGGQDAPVRQGTNHMGLHPETGEFVTPKGVLTADGWTDNPEMVYLDREITPERAWALNPDTHTDYNPKDVLEIIDLATSMRNSERLIPVLGWLYSAAVRPYIQQWEGQFNSAHISGETGAGKSKSLAVLWGLFGMDGVPMEVDDTKFALITALASTNSIPMWFDEYKPGDMAEHEVNRFQNLMRDTTVGGVSTRGNADKSTEQYKLLAPLLISGEQRIQGNAEERRSIQTRFLKNVQEKGSSTQIAYSELAGIDYQDDEDTMHYPEARDLSQHALAFYQFILGLEVHELRNEWRSAREHVGNLLGKHDIDSLDDLPTQGLQTVYFGMKLVRWFVDSLEHEAGVPDTNCVPSAESVDDAVLYAARELGGDNGGQKNHLDDFIELLARAAQAEYLERDTHYTVVKEGTPEQELALHLATCHDAVSKYARVHDINSVDLLNSASDYRDHMKEYADKNDSYVITHSQVTTGLNRCARIDPLHAADALDFNINAFDFDVSAPNLKTTETSSASSNLEIASDGGDNLFAKVTNAIIQLGNANGTGAKPSAIQRRVEDNIDSVDELDAVLMRGIRNGKFEMDNDGAFSFVENKSNEDGSSSDDDSNEDNDTVSDKEFLSDECEDAKIEPKEEQIDLDNINLGDDEEVVVSVLQSTYEDIDTARLAEKLAGDISVDAMKNALRSLEQQGLVEITDFQYLHLQTDD